MLAEGELPKLVSKEVSSITVSRRPRLSIATLLILIDKLRRVRRERSSGSAMEAEKKTGCVLVLAGRLEAISVMNSRSGKDGEGSRLGQREGRGDRSRKVLGHGDGERTVAGLQ